MNSISPQMLDLISGNVALLKTLGEGEGPARGATLRRLLGVARRRRWILIGSVLAGLGVGFAVTALTPRQYDSTVRLQVSRETTQVVNVGAISRDVSIGDQEFYQTQYGLLRAQSLAERVARDLGADDDPAFFKRFRQGDAFAADRARRNEIAADILLSHVQIAPVHGSSLVDVQARTPSPQLSQRIAQTWGRDFIASNLERRMGASSYARQYLENRLEQLRGRLESSERRAMEYAARHGIIDLPAQSNNTKLDRAQVVQDRSLTSDDLIALNAELEAATADRIAAASELSAFGGHPDEASDGAAKSEQKRIAASLQQTYQAALARERGLSQRVNALKVELADLRQRAIQYRIYQRDADANRALYDGLLQRYKEIGVAAEAENNNVAVVDAARLPEAPSSPRLPVNLLLYTLGATLLGVIVVGLLEQLDDGTKAGAPSPVALAEPALSP